METPHQISLARQQMMERELQYDTEFSICEEQQTFRNELASVNPDGTRKWVYAQKPEGMFTNARSVASIVLLGFFFGAPFVRIQGNPLMLFNVLERKFILFGVVFWTQDFYLLVLTMVTAIVSIAVFTAVWGRLFCGWACPQTIFLEQIYRRIEYLIEGNARERIALDKAAWTTKKVVKKVSKHAIYIAIAWVISNLFLAYVIGTDELFRIITDSPRQHIGGLAAMTVFAGLFYGVFAHFREQVCLVACPYGRFQSALVDNDTIAVTYDFKRGEPRKKPSKADKTGTSTEPRGDCIDCMQCVNVCPTGIDIRNGIQLECVNCTACMDACDSVMTKVKKPTGLIRYTSYNAVKSGQWNFFSTRVKGYLGVWIVLVMVLGTLFVRRPSMESVIMRQPGTLYQTMGESQIANFYNIQLINKTFIEKNVELRLLSPKGIITPLADYSSIKPQSVQHGRCFVAIPKGELHGMYNTITFGVFVNGECVRETETTFLAPEK
jgi:cytochrome c oxidase accessory protein FixG